VSQKRRNERGIEEIPSTKIVALGEFEARVWAE
jgi:hypothetical protein